MSSLLSKNDYIDIAAKIQFPTDPFINGRFQKSKAGKVMAVSYTHLRAHET